MAIDPDDYLTGTLAVFDSINLESKYARRTAVKPMYDYYQVLVLEAAVRLCGLNRTSLENQHLWTRWTMIKSALVLVDNPSIWDQHIRHTANERDSVDHNDACFPTTQSLSDIRKKAPEFKNWLLESARKYKAESGNFSFLQDFLLNTRWYASEAEAIISKYGETPPYSLESREGEEYKRIKPLSDKLLARIPEVNEINKLTKEDLADLIELVKQIERLDARETILLRFGICSKCGGKIVNTQREVGGQPEGPPSAIIYRAGCEKCDYELNNETINL